MDAADIDEVAPRNVVPEELQEGAVDISEEKDGGILKVSPSHNCQISIPTYSNVFIRPILCMIGILVMIICSDVLNINKKYSY